MLIAIIMPNTLPKSKRFKLKQEEYKFLRKYMSMYPSESKDPDLNKKQFSLLRKWKNEILYLWRTRKRHYS
ncbi:MAG: hypothetical protein KatS3mg035_0652 [Bacteroidia bacterium]|nr:MAG: hypothetical protein KatS3mg035_0652 [Bacteroidia bacterium]